MRGGFIFRNRGPSLVYKLKMKLLQMCNERGNFTFHAACHPAKLPELGHGHFLPVLLAILVSATVSHVYTAIFAILTCAALKVVPGRRPILSD
jgi:hypothetical protein